MADRTNITFRHFSPDDILRPYIDCFWYAEADLEDGTESAEQLCLPMGMTDLVFLAGKGSCAVFEEGQWTAVPAALITGIYRDAIRWKARGPLRKFGIRFKPESIIRLFQRAPAAIYGQYVEAETFLGKSILPLVNRITQATDPEEMVRIAEASLADRLRCMPEEQHYLYEAAGLIRKQRGTLSIEALSDQLFISKRQLERSFKEQLGASPKTYNRIIRFRNAYQYLTRQETPSWAGISYELGYADQAHFIRDFKTFTADTPPAVLFRKAQEQRLAAAVH